MDYWEKFFIATLKTKSPNGYKLTDGGEGVIGFVEEVWAKISAKHKGIPKFYLFPIKCATLIISKLVEIFNLPAEYLLKESD